MYEMTWYVLWFRGRTLKIEPMMLPNAKLIITPSQLPFSSLASESLNCFHLRIILWRKSSAGSTLESCFLFRALLSWLLCYAASNRNLLNCLSIFCPDFVATYLFVKGITWKKFPFCYQKLKSFHQIFNFFFLNRFWIEQWRNVSFLGSPQMQFKRRDENYLEQAEEKIGGEKNRQKWASWNSWPGV